MRCSTVALRVESSEEQAIIEGIVHKIVDIVDINPYG